MASPTNMTKKDTMTQPQITPTVPPLSRPKPYSGTIPVKSVMVEKAIASSLNMLCTKMGQTGIGERLDKLTLNSRF